MTALAVVLVAPLVAGPTLTTIQDAVYNANGIPYNGIAIINWTPFQAGDTSAIATQQVTVAISNGAFMVQLVPTTNANPAGYYAVTFASAGNDQFTENWAVRPSTKPLRILDVLLPGSTSPPPIVSGQTPLPEANVIGLLADLAVRPVEGPLCAPGSVAFIDPTGLLESVTGKASDCVHVDGSSGPCGSDGGSSAGPVFADGEVPAGSINGSNAAFTVRNVPLPASSLALYRNGILQKAGQDYTIAGNAIQFAGGAAPQPGDTLLASYRVTGAGMAQGPAAAEVLCSGTGTATSNTAMTRLGTCTIPAGTLRIGDRVQVSFDLSHEGLAGGFIFAAGWGSTLMVQRNGTAGDAFVAARAEAGVGVEASQLSMQSWGTVMPLAAGAENATDSTANPIAVAFSGMLAGATTDTITLRNFTVVRYPAAP